MLCSTFNFQGLSAECKAYLRKVIGVEMTRVGVTSTAAEFIAFAANKVIVADEGGITGIVIDLSNGYERTTDDPEISTANTGRKMKTTDPIPSMTGLAVLSACDYKTFGGADGMMFDFRLLLEAKMIMGTNQADGTKKGFRGRMYVRFDLPVSTNGQEAFPFMIFFDDVEEFKDFTVDTAEFKMTELIDAVPNGVDISLNTAYASGGNVILNTVKRCTGEPYSGFAAAAQWNVIEVSAGVADVDVVTAAVVNGVNTLNIKKNASTTPIDLAAGEWAVVQGQLDDSIYVTYISDLYKVTA